MKKIVILLAVLLISTFASWATGLSFTIYPDYTGNFRIFYSTYNAPAEFAVTVDWGNEEYHNFPKAETGSDPTKMIQGSVTKGKPIKIYSDHLDAIYIVDNVQAIKCEANNPQLEYIYYFNDNLSPEKLEALYMSLYSRNGKTGYGELHLSTSTSIENASTNILKSNAFIPEGINWRVCSKKAWTGSTSARINWKLDKANCKTYLIPAITISTPTTANITDLQLGIKLRENLPWTFNYYTVKIDDGTSNLSEAFVSNYATYLDFMNHAMKLTVKGVVAPGAIKIYGAMISDISVQQISALNLSNTSNMRFINVSNSSNLTAITGLSSQPLLQELYLYRNTNLTSVDVQSLPKLTDLSVAGCYKLSQLYFNRTSLEYLNFSQCSKLKLASLSNLSDATKLTYIVANDLGWDACAMDELYRALRSPAPSGAEVYVQDDDSQGGPSNDWEGSNKTIATAKGWSVIREYNGGAEQKLTGDGGGCMPIQYTNIPDANFLNALKALGHGTGVVGNTIPTANLRGITALDVSNKSIRDLTGIEDFVALTTLKCNTNNLSVLNVSQNTALIYLYLSNNTVGSLNLSNNIVLKELNVNYNSLKALDVSNNTALKHLNCYGNSLNTIDVSNNKALESLSCGGNALSVLDVSQNNKLTVLNCPSSPLTSLDIRNGNNANVTFFKATDNPNLSCIYVGNKNASYLSSWQKDAGARFVTSEAECSGTVAYTNIPDTNFLNALKALGHGAGAVGNTIPTANLSGITKLDVSGKNISNLTGIKDFIALEELFCYSNKLSSLDVSKNTSLTTLSCSKNQLSSLDVSANTALTFLSCSKNQLSSLDVSKNIALEYLHCFDNQLTSLDVRNRNNSQFITFEAHNNPNLSCIYVDNKAASYLSGWIKDAGAKFVKSESECGVTVAYTNIPDTNFLNALKALGHGAGAVGNTIPTANLSGITTLNVSEKNISDLTGIQDFVALTTLKCEINNLSVLNVSKNTKLTELNCGENKLESLDVSKNIALIDLKLDINDIPNLDVSKNTALNILWCDENDLSVLDVSKNTKLIELWCTDNNLSVLDVSKNTALTKLSCAHNNLSALDVTKNIKLTYFDCAFNLLTSLDVRNGNNVKLLDFYATDNADLSCIYVDDKTASYLSSWDKDATAKFVNIESECGETVAYTNIPDANFLQALKDLGHGAGAVGNDVPTANLSEITSLTLTYKDISSLSGIKDFAALEILKCDGNNLTNLDVSKNKALTSLDCEQNQITILNVSGNTALLFLNCADNAMTSIFLTKNLALEELICYENQLESIDVSKNTKLISLKCSSNLVPILDVSKNKDLTELDCVENDLKTLDVSKNTALKHLDCRYNEISVLDLSMNTKLTGLYCNDNKLISLDIRNGNNVNVTYFDATKNPNLSCIYVDDKTASYLSDWEKDATAKFVNTESECTTSVSDFKEQDISIYPNPTNGILNFDFSAQQIQNINISDVLGKKVFEKNNPNQNEVIDLSSFVNGTYIITLQIENENRSFKIIKQ
ncbi:MAG TPA: T9SS type A sorting domain-containing protein [Prolixibacteraceae bacterium]|nr:T9SS type A sorting domain-containing protein [Prolixibacteraceae bacterium]